MSKVLKAAHSLYKPTIDGTWKDFKSYFGAVGNGSHDDSSALADWLTYGVGLGSTQAKLYVPAGDYTFSGSVSGPYGWWNNGIKNSFVYCEPGATTDAFWAGPINGFYEDFVHSARIFTASAGQTYVDLITASQASIFTVGDWVFIAGIGLQFGLGFPPNFQFFDYRQVTGISGSRVSFSEPLTYDYLSTWPYLDGQPVTFSNTTPTTITSVSSNGHGHVSGPSGSNWVFFTADPGGTLPTGITSGARYYVSAESFTTNTFRISDTDGGATIGVSSTGSGTIRSWHSSYDVAGPATIYKMHPDWNADSIVVGMTVRSTGTQPQAVGRNTTLFNCHFGANSLAPTVGKTILIKNCTLCTDNTRVVEVDKLVENLIFEGCYSKGTVLSQSGSIRNLYMKDCTIVNGAAVGGCGYNSYFDNVFADDARIGALFYGACKTITVNRCNFVTGVVSGHYIDPAQMTYVSNGLFKTPKITNVSYYGTAIPGKSYAFAYISGTATITPDSGGTVHFKITDMYEDANWAYMQTDLVGSLPTPTFSGGHATNAYLMYGAETVTQTNRVGSSLDLTQFAAP